MTSAKAKPAHIAARIAAAYQQLRTGREILAFERLTIQTRGTGGRWQIFYGNLWLAEYQPATGAICLRGQLHPQACRGVAHAARLAVHAKRQLFAGIRNKLDPERAGACSGAVLADKGVLNESTDHE